MTAVLPPLGWLLAALLFGLWWGERGRRRAAERWARLARDTDDGPARKLPRSPSTAERLTRLPPVTPAPVESHVARLARVIRERVKRKGLSLSDDALAREAERLTNRALGRE